MPWYNFLTDLIHSKNKEGSTEKKKEEPRKVLTVKEMMEELGLARSGVVGSYEEEENPDNLGPLTYIQMQENDGEVAAIVKLLSLPIQSTPISIVPAKNDRGERDFIETVFTAPEYMGGMSTPLPFLIADMTRAIFEGFRFYEKVPQIIDKGKYKGKIGWRKLAPRDAQTIKLRTDEHGGFNGAFQRATFGSKTVSVVIPPEKSMLFTFRKEKHWLYGESILKAAYYHYDKKHKLYYIAHKKAEVEALGLKILRINQNITPSERTKAEEVVDTIGINSRITLPPGIELEINRETGGFDVMPLIEHHNLQMARSALASAIDQVKYAYPYGRGTTQSQFLIMAIHSIMRQMESTLNTYAVAPLIDWNFGSNAYPQIKFSDLSVANQVLLNDVFNLIMRRRDTMIPDGFIEEVTKRIAKKLNLEWVSDTKPANKNLQAFERGKIIASNKLKIEAPKTPEELKEKVEKLDGPESEVEAWNLGYNFVYEQKNSQTK